MIEKYKKIWNTRSKKTVQLTPQLVKSQNPKAGHRPEVSAPRPKPKILQPTSRQPARHAMQNSAG
ncbi:hypothetical protein CYR55_23045 [Chimaeribacter californicus]|uniref:Uncharacterized protein n=1 Tax=Chimaeribacter californicus TaxID=2060067 RepID=A0A2N5DSP2_9GAMM|nr:hypothetical protein CYR55_23045 [Chimaeribacter californicus]